MNWIETDKPDCTSTLSLPQITAVHSNNDAIRWSTLGQGRFAGDDGKITAVALLDLLTFCLDSAIRFPSALKEQDRRADR